MDSINSFRNALEGVVEKNTLHQNNWTNDSWKTTWPLITQEVLNDAFQKQEAIKQVLPSKIGTIQLRPSCKKLARVEEKMIDQKYPNYFKVTADFIGLRVLCNVNQIQERIDILRETVLAKDGQIYLKGSTEACPYGSCLDENKKYKDIIQYANVFIKEIGYPIEVQIGSKFAMHTFTLDSALRDNPLCGKIDLWSKGFYNDVKNYLLSRANGEKVDVEANKQIEAKATEIHNKEVTPELKEILNDIGISAYHRSINSGVKPIVANFYF